jgi:hypothetical protein
MRFALAAILFRCRHGTDESSIAKDRFFAASRGRRMHARMIAIGVACCATLLSLRFGPVHAAELVWRVDNPFRLYKHAKSFKLHEDAFDAVRGEQGAELPANIVQRVDHCLNDAAVADAPARAACAASNRTNGVDARKGWAAGTLADLCYDRNAHPRGYPAMCRRERGRRLVAEDLVLPSDHSVVIGLAPVDVAAARDDACTWRFKPRAGGEWVEGAPQSCAKNFLIARVPYAPDGAASGVIVEVKLPDGRTLTDPNVIVDDLLIVAIGDSFASGEGNPDSPVTFSAGRAMDYRPPRLDPSMAMMDLGLTHRLPARGAVDRIRYDPYVLPRRLLQDEETELQYPFASAEFHRAFWERSAQWFSPDCHRSQYGHPFRVALELALEDRHRAITLIDLACSGAEVVKGLFLAMEAREHFDTSPAKTKMVAAQFDQLTNLICRSHERIDSAPFPLQVFEPGSRQPRDQTIRMKWCPRNSRKRAIDLVLLSVGGNDVGFSALAAYTFLDRAGDIAAIAQAKEGELRFDPSVAETYLGVLDARFEAMRRALEQGFGVGAARVIETSYERIELDEDGRLCGNPARDTLGMDVHNKFKLNQARLQEVSVFLGRLLDRLQCIAGRARGCPANLRTGEGTGFTLVVEHQPEFLRRGICARDPARRDADERMMKMPRLPIGSPAPEFWPYSPAAFRPYAHRWRLFRTPNDAFLTANEHKGGETPIFDILQPAVAALYSGAFHPTAEAHVIVADHVVPHARRILATRSAADRTTR